ncbi:hypothetical protein TEA_020418 [Camellia sinensis var. sinensis]|uniref:Uncharacterized protein n=1 Tax=Camellia sinensis var. sinensis TaxID=542762 RepID=A0A4S4CVT7_CAMSN|nr:hypothetical protein TEA_020418 [Camellia sinensis var. sinensis]
MIRVCREGLKIEWEQKEERISGVGGGMWGRQWLCRGGGGAGSVAVVHGKITVSWAVFRSRTRVSCYLSARMEKKQLKNGTHHLTCLICISACSGVSVLDTGQKRLQKQVEVSVLHVLFTVLLSYLTWSWRHLSLLPQGMKKHKLLREDILPAMASNRKVQRLLNEFMDLLSEYEITEIYPDPKNPDPPTTLLQATDRMHYAPPTTAQTASDRPSEDQTCPTLLATDEMEYAPTATDQTDSVVPLTDEVQSTTPTVDLNLDPPASDQLNSAMAS